MDVVPIREADETQEDDPLAAIQAIMWGLLFGAIFWLLIGGAAGLLLEMAKL